MRKSYFLLAFITILIFDFSYSQNSGIFIPREVQNAINKGTRSITGKPGENYWQNKIEYTIEASFEPKSGKLVGKETVKFTNNSPSSLSRLLINLYPDLYKKGNTRDKEVKVSDVHNGTIIHKISIDGRNIDPKGAFCSYKGTILTINLPNSLLSKNKLNLIIEWEYTMPNKTTIRVGKYGKNSWFIGYWYPQIAVYDDLFGWDDISYDGLHEFYSPFANFDIKITMPSEQIVWATGIWQNPEAILENTYLRRYEKAQKSEKRFQIVGIEDLNKKITTSKKEHTWHFLAENVPDFSFATSDHYLWDGLLASSDKNPEQKTFIQTAYDKGSIDFYDVADISKATIQYLSDSMPGIPFPYPSLTVFNGGGGMEFPMMVNDRSETTKASTVNLTSHEISHTYFPFYMGINQERYSWMDEGWAQFLPAEFQTQFVSYNDQASYSAFVYNFYAGNSLELPMMIPSFNIKGYEYYVASYYRPELAYRNLENLLGKKLFKEALQEYIFRWNGKYPSPYDFFYTFNDVAKEDLSWFWKPWFFEMAYPDLAIVNIKKNKGEWEVGIKNIGGLPLPIQLAIKYTDGSSEKLSRTVKLWQDENNVILIKHQTKKHINSVILGNSRIPDINKRDNRKTIK